MFRTSLLTATALVLCVSAVSAAWERGRPNDRIVPPWMRAERSAHVAKDFPAIVRGTTDNAVRAHATLSTPKYPNAIFDNIDWKDKNQEWLSYYGFSVNKSSYSYYYSSHSWVKEAESASNALPFEGTGKKARKIGVPLFNVYSFSGEFNVGIYSATASGLPGNELAGGSTTASDSDICCTQLRWVDIDIKLKAGRQYFLAVSCGVGQSTCYGGWLMEQTGEDYFHVRETESYDTAYSGGTQHYTYSSPWHETVIKAEGAAIIK
jgi:hypothetical protein